MDTTLDTEPAQKNTKPRVTLEAVEANIKDTTFYQHGLLTVCVLTLKNDFKVTGETACAYPENFDLEIGQRIALENAKQKIWPLMGYELKTFCFNEAMATVDMVGSNPFIRLQAEAEELNGRISKLYAFIQGPLFLATSGEQQKLMHEQFDAMENLHTILMKRIAGWNT